MQTVEIMEEECFLLIKFLYSFVSECLFKAFSIITNVHETLGTYIRDASLTHRLELTNTSNDF